MKSLLYILSILMLGTILQAQEVFQPKQVENSTKGILYKKENNLNFRLHTHGFALGYMNGTIKSYERTSYYTFELGFLKHPQQFKRPLQAINSGNIPNKPYYYGKINNFMQLRIGYKNRKYLSEKSKRNGIAIGYSYQIAAVAGIEKPYYLIIKDFSDNPQNPFYGTKSIKYSDDPVKFLNEKEIIGASKYLKGLWESNIVPGLSAQIDVLFAWGAYDRFSRSIEAGIIVDIFPRSIKIMANEQNSPIFINAHINFIFGSRK